MKRVLFFVLAIAFVGCTKTEYSETLHESATVLQTIYTPATHGTGIGPTVTGNGSGVTVVSIDTEPVYAVIFECQHGKFIIEGSDKRHKSIFYSLKAGEAVEVEYREVYTVRSDGRHLVKYDFLTARNK